MKWYWKELLILRNLVYIIGIGLMLFVGYNVYRASTSIVERSQSECVPQIVMVTLPGATTTSVSIAPPDVPAPVLSAEQYP